MGRLCISLLDYYKIQIRSDSNDSKTNNQGRATFNNMDQNRLWDFVRKPFKSYKEKENLEFYTKFVAFAIAGVVGPWSGFQISGKKCLLVIMTIS